MRIFGTRLTGLTAAVFAGAMTLGHAGWMQAQLPAGSAGIHGHTQNPAGQPLLFGEVRLTQDRNPSASSAKFEYTFPIDQNGDYKGTVDKPGNYIAVIVQMVGQQEKRVDYMPAALTAGADKAVDFDMTRKEFMDKMSPADREAIEDFKKKNAETQATNAQIGNLNKMLIAAREANKAGHYDEALKDMTDATTAKPDVAVLWVAMGDAQMGQASVAAKAAHDAKATDASLPAKYDAAIASYKKAIDLNAALAKPNLELAAAANNQLGQAYGKTNKMQDAAAAYEAAAKADPPKAASYYYNEAATLFNGNDIDNAAAAADKAIAADPTKADAYYIKAQALVQKATVDSKTNKVTAPAECVAAYQKYLELAPTGPRAEEVKLTLQGIGEPIKSSYKAPKR
jgi:tetratricopeptide (TPR) repeat protein